MGTVVHLGMASEREEGGTQCYVEEMVRKFGMGVPTHIVGIARHRRTLDERIRSMKSRYVGYTFTVLHKRW